MNFKQYLTEARLAPLYHGTTFQSMAKLLEIDKFPAKNHFHMINGKEVHGISTSRSLAFSLAWRSGRYRFVFEFDQQKLATKHKIYPFNFFPEDGTRNQYTSNKARLDKDEYPHGFSNQMEEYVVGTIKPLNSYISKLIISDYHGFKEGIESGKIIGKNHYNEDVNISIIMNHPKLYDLKTKKFVNT